MHKKALICELHVSHKGNNETLQYYYHTMKLISADRKFQNPTDKQYQ